MTNILIKNPLFPDRPLMYAALGFGSGLTLAKSILGTGAWVLAAAFTLLGIFLQLYKFRRASLILIMCTLGLIRLQLAYPTLPQPVESCVITGKICDTPVYSSYGWRVTLNDAKSDGKRINGRVLLNLPDNGLDYEPSYGMTVTATASLYLPEGAKNEGGMDMRFYYFTKGISCTAYCLNEEVELIYNPPDIFGRLLQLRKKSSDILIKLIGQENGSLAACMLHGDTSEIPSDTLDAFRGSGVAHLLAVSGLHVSLIVGALLVLLKRVRHLPQLIIVTVFLIFYTAFTAFSSSTVRAGVMALCLLLGRAASRRNDPLTSLSLAFLLITIVSPFSIFMVGFQLSFTAVLGILLLYPMLIDTMKSLPDPISSALGISLSGQIATFPATAAYFGRLPILSVFANMLIVPLAPLVVLPAGSALLLYPFSSKLAGIVAGIADVTLHMMRSVASLVADMGAFSASAPPFFACVLYFLAMLFLSKNCLAPCKPKYLLSGCCFLLCLITWNAPNFTRPSAYIDVLDVKSGYAAYLHSPGVNTLIGNEHSLRSDTVNSYMRCSGVHSYTISETDRSGSYVTIGNEVLYIAPGYVEVRGVRYSTFKNGRIRIQTVNGDPILQKFSRDEIYAILIE